MILIRHYTPLLGIYLASNKKAFKFSFPNSIAFFSKGGGILSIIVSRTVYTLIPFLAEI